MLQGQLRPQWRPQCAAVRRESGAVASARGWSDVVVTADMRGGDPVGVVELMQLADSLERAD